MSIITNKEAVRSFHKTISQKEKEKFNITFDEFNKYLENDEWRKKAYDNITKLGYPYSFDDFERTLGVVKSDLPSPTDELQQMSKPENNKEMLSHLPQNLQEESKKMGIQPPKNEERTFDDLYNSGDIYSYMEKADEQGNDKTLRELNNYAKERRKAEVEAIDKKIAELENKGGYWNQRAISAYKNAKENLNAPSKYDDVTWTRNFVADAALGLWQNLDEEKIPYGGAAIEAGDYIKAAGIIKDINNKKEISEDDKDFLNAFMAFINSSREDTSIGYKGGAATSESVPLVAEMAVAGMTLGGSGAATVAAQTAKKTATKAAMEVIKEYAKKTAKGAAKHVGITAMTPTVWAKEMSQDYFGHAARGEDYGVGDFFTGVGSALLTTGVERGTGKLLSPITKHIPIPNILKQTGKWAKYAALDDIPTEIAEEYIEALASLGRSYIDPIADKEAKEGMRESWKELTTAEGFGTTATSVAIMSLMGKGVNAGLLKKKNSDLKKSAAAISKTLSNLEVGGDVTNGIMSTLANSKVEDGGYALSICNKKLRDAGVDNKVISEFNKSALEYLQNKASANSYMSEFNEAYNNLSKEDKASLDKAIINEMNQQRAGRLATNVVGKHANNTVFTDESGSKTYTKEQLLEILQSGGKTEAEKAVYNTLRDDIEKELPYLLVENIGMREAKVQKVEQQILRKTAERVAQAKGMKRWQVVSEYDNIYERLKKGEVLTDYEKDLYDTFTKERERVAKLFRNTNKQFSAKLNTQEKIEVPSVEQVLNEEKKQEDTPEPVDISAPTNDVGSVPEIDTEAVTAKANATFGKISSKDGNLYEVSAVVNGKQVEGALKGEIALTEDGGLDIANSKGLMFVPKGNGKYTGKAIPLTDAEYNSVTINNVFNKEQYAEQAINNAIQEAQAVSFNDLVKQALQNQTQAPESTEGGVAETPKSTEGETTGGVVEETAEQQEVAPVEETSALPKDVKTEDVNNQIVENNEMVAEGGNAPLAEISNDERAEMEARIVDWLSEENLERAEGKTREEIFDEFGNELEPIAYIPKQYISLVSADLKDQRIYCGKGYFIDHALRNHAKDGKQLNVEDVDVSKYLNIQSVLDNPDSVKETYVDGKRTVVFIKKIGRYFAELTQVEEDGKIVLHKSMFNQKKEPYAKLNDIRSKGTSSEGGVSSISHTAEAAPAISLESRGDVVSNSNVSSVSEDTNIVPEKQEKVVESDENNNQTPEEVVQQARLETVQARHLMEQQRLTEAGYATDAMLNALEERTEAENKFYQLLVNFGVTLNAKTPDPTSNGYLGSISNQRAVKNVPKEAREELLSAAAEYKKAVVNFKNTETLEKKIAELPLPKNAEAIERNEETIQKSRAVLNRLKAMNNALIDMMVEDGDFSFEKLVVTSYLDKDNGELDEDGLSAKDRLGMELSNKNQSLSAERILTISEFEKIFNSLKEKTRKPSKKKTTIDGLSESEVVELHIKKRRGGEKTVYVAKSDYEYITNEKDFSKWIQTYREVDGVYKKINNGKTNLVEILDENGEFKYKQVVEEKVVGNLQVVKTDWSPLDIVSQLIKDLKDINKKYENITEFSQLKEQVVSFKKRVAFLCKKINDSDIDDTTKMELFEKLDFAYFAQLENAKKEEKEELEPLEGSVASAIAKLRTQNKKNTTLKSQKTGKEIKLSHRETVGDLKAVNKKIYSSLIDTFEAIEKTLSSQDQKNEDVELFTEKKGKKKTKNTKKESEKIQEADKNDPLAWSYDDKIDFAGIDENTEMDVFNHYSQMLYDKGKTEGSKPISAKKVLASISNLISRLNLQDRVLVAMNLEQLKKINEQAYEAEVNKEKVRGFYLPSKHQIVLYIPNLLSEGAAEETIFHEGIAHFGLRELFGEEEFNNFCKQVWKVMSFEDRKAMIEYVRGEDYEGKDKKEVERLLEKVTEREMLAAADEYIAHLAQTPAFVEYLKNRNEQEAVSWMNKKWKKVCDLIRKIFKKQTGVDVMTNEEKVMDALYRSYQLLGSEEYATFSYYRSLAEQMRKYDVKVGEINEGELFSSENSSSTQEQGTILFSKGKPAGYVNLSNKFKPQKKPMSALVAREQAVANAVMEWFREMVGAENIVTNVRAMTDVYINALNNGERIRVLHTTSNGEDVLLGFEHNGVHYLDMGAMDSGLLLYELGSVWVDILKKNDALWERAKEVCQSTKEYKSLVKTAAYKRGEVTEEDVVKEVLAYYISELGTRLGNNLNVSNGIKEEFEHKIGFAFAELKNTLSRFDEYELSKLGVGDFARLSLRDIVLNTSMADSEAVVSDLEDSDEGKTPSEKRLKNSTYGWTSPRKNETTGEYLERMSRLHLHSLSRQTRRDGDSIIAMIQSAIEKASGKMIPEAIDVYNIIDSVNSVVANRVETFEKKLWNPLRNTLDSMGKKLMRNKEISSIRKARKLSTIEWYLRAKDIVEYSEIHKKDRGRKGLENVLGMTLERYIGIVEGTLGQDNINSLWNKINEITDITIKNKESAGVLDATDLATMKRRYYIPEKGFDTDAENDGDGNKKLTRKSNRVSSSYQKERSTKGRGNSVSDSPSFNIFTDMVASIQAKEHMRLNNAFYGLIEYAELYDKGIADRFFKRTENGSLIHKEGGDIRVGNLDEKNYLVFNETKLSGKLKDVLETNQESISAFTSWWKGWVSKTYTGWRTSFAIVNLGKDLFQTIPVVYMKYGPKTTGKVILNLLNPVTIFELLSYIYARKTYKSDNESLSYIYGQEKLIKEFFENGVATGYLEYRNDDDVRKAMGKGLFDVWKNKYRESALGQMTSQIESPIWLENAGNVAEKIVTSPKYIGKAVRGISDWSEIAPRYALYKTLREDNYSMHSARMAARNTTMNLGRDAGGKFYKMLGRIIPFYRARVDAGEAWNRALFEMQEGDNGYKKVLRVVTMLAPAVILGLFTFNDDDDDKDEDSFIRTDNFFTKFFINNFPVNVSESFVPFLQLGNGIKRYLKGEKEASDVALDFIAGICQTVLTSNNFSEILIDMAKSMLTKGIIEEKDFDRLVSQYLNELPLATAAVNMDAFGNKIAIENNDKNDWANASGEADYLFRVIADYLHGFDDERLGEKKSYIGFDEKGELETFDAKTLYDVNSDMLQAVVYQLFKPAEEAIKPLSNILEQKAKGEEFSWMELGQNVPVVKKSFVDYPKTSKEKLESSVRLLTYFDNYVSHASKGEGFNQLNNKEKSKYNNYLKSSLFEDDNTKLNDNAAQWIREDGLKKTIIADMEYAIEYGDEEYCEKEFRKYDDCLRNVRKFLFGN